MTSLKVICGGWGISVNVYGERWMRGFSVRAAGLCWVRWGVLEAVGLGFLNWAGSTSSGFCEGELLCWGPIGELTSPMNTSTHKLYLCVCSHTYLRVQTETPSYKRIYTTSTRSHTEAHWAAAQTRMSRIQIQLSVYLLALFIRFENIRITGPWRPHINLSVFKSGIF